MLDQPKHGVLPYILPFLAFMLVSMFEPRFPTQDQDAIDFSQTASVETLSDGQRYALQERENLTTKFLLTYGFKVLLTTALLIYFAKSYLAQFPITISWLSWATGIVGVVLWIALCHLELESRIVGMFSEEPAGIRSQFNPFAQLTSAWHLYLFLAVRFFGLVIMVPICEELLLRGLLMRYIESPEWWTVFLGKLSFRTLLVAPLYGVLTHPTEALAAIVWFSLITMLVRRTGKFWDAVIAHAVTNGLLGLYVCLFSQWQLW